VYIEPTNLYSDNKRPDLLIHAGARTYSVDVTVKHPLSPSYIPNLAQRALGVAEEGERIKTARYALEAQLSGQQFVPFSLESLGGWGPAARGLVNSLAEHAGRHTNYSSREAYARLVQGVSLAIQRGNAFLLYSAYQHCSAARNIAPRGSLFDSFVGRNFAV
jgi:hypothetical protein